MVQVMMGIQCTVYKFNLNELNDFYWLTKQHLMDIATLNLLVFITSVLLKNNIHTNVLI